MDSTDGIFLTINGKLTVLSEQPYEKEKVLQEALATHPDVIAGPTTTGEGAGNLLLVRREMGIPGEADGKNVWSVDHLFLDAEGVPVIVETKRSSDTRIRREVVGQMLDYAANGTEYWPVATLRKHVADAAAKADRTEDQVIAELRGDDLAPDDFWQMVADNLTQGRIRLVFVADQLPRELIRIIEFLNEQMNSAEVLGVEVRQYVDTKREHVAYVPSVVGRTSRAQQTKETASGGQYWTQDALVAVARERRTTPQVELIEQLLAHASDAGHRGHALSFGNGVTAGVSGWYTVASEPAPVWNLNVGGDRPGNRAYMLFYFADLLRKGRVTVDVIEAAASKLETIPAMAGRIGEARKAGWMKQPSVYLPDLVTDPKYASILFEAIETLTGEIPGQQHSALPEPPAVP